jgi:hypothetical protein
MLTHQARLSLGSNGSSAPKEERSIAFGIDECHVIDFLHREIVSIRMTDEDFKDIHVDGRIYFRFCLHRGKENLLRTKTDNENYDDGNDVIGTHNASIALG